MMDDTTFPKIFLTAQTLLLKMSASFVEKNVMNMTPHPVQGEKHVKRDASPEKGRIIRQK
jgi:hypothetical protein